MRAQPCEAKEGPLMFQKTSKPITICAAILISLSLAFSMSPLMAGQAYAASETRVYTWGANETAPAIPSTIKTTSGETLKLVSKTEPTQTSASTSVSMQFDKQIDGTCGKDELGNIQSIMPSTASINSSGFVGEIPRVKIDYTDVRGIFVRHVDKWVDAETTAQNENLLPQYKVIDGDQLSKQSGTTKWTDLGNGKWKATTLYSGDFEYEDIDHYNLVAHYSGTISKSVNAGDWSVTCVYDDGSAPAVAGSTSTFKDVENNTTTPGNNTIANATLQNNENKQSNNESTPQPISTEGDDQQSGNENQQGIPVLLIAGIAATILLICGAAAFLIIKKKREGAGAKEEAREGEGLWLDEEDVEDAIDDLENGKLDVPAIYSATAFSTEDDPFEDDGEEWADEEEAFDSEEDAAGRFDEIEVESIYAGREMEEEDLFEGTEFDDEEELDGNDTDREDQTISATEDEFDDEIAEEAPVAAADSTQTGGVESEDDDGEDGDFEDDEEDSLAELHEYHVGTGEDINRGAISFEPADDPETPNFVEIPAIPSPDALDKSAEYIVLIDVDDPSIVSDSVVITMNEQVIYNGGLLDGQIPLDFVKLVAAARNTHEDTIDKLDLTSEIESLNEMEFDEGGEDIDIVGIFDEGDLFGKNASGSKENSSDYVVDDLYEVETYDVEAEQEDTPEERGAQARDYDASSFIGRSDNRKASVAEDDADGSLADELGDLDLLMEIPDEVDFAIDDDPRDEDGDGFISEEERDNEDDNGTLVFVDKEPIATNERGGSAVASGSHSSHGSEAVAGGGADEEREVEAEGEDEGEEDIEDILRRL